MFTKARYGGTIKASKPIMNQEGQNQSLYKARHPSIPIEEVVANDINIRYKLFSDRDNGSKHWGKNSYNKDSRVYVH